MGNLRRVLLVAWVGIALGCGGIGEQRADEGSVAIDVQQSALSAADAARVTLRVSGVGIAPDIVRDLARQGSGWRGVIGGIPAGTDRVFHADAYDISGTIIYQGQATATITKANTVMVTIVLQQKTPPNPFVNHVPVITSLVASSTQVAPGDQLALGASGYDMDEDDYIRWIWSAPAGTFDTPNSNISKWTAPSTEGLYDLTITASDGRGGVRSATLRITVSYGNAHGTAIVVADLNTWPEIARVTANPGRIGAGEAAALLASASDADGDALRYAWTDDCSGRFSDTAAPDPTWNAPLPAPASGVCNLNVVVTDARGGVNTGTLTVQVGSDASFAIAPSVLGTFQSTDTVVPGEAIRFQVEAVDPEGGSLSFQWTASVGTLGTPGAITNPSGSTTSQVDWTPPAGPGPFVVTVIITDPSGLRITRSFTVGGDLVADQSQLVSQNMYSIGLEDDYRARQTVTVGRTGRLVGVELSIFLCSAGADPLASLVLLASANGQPIGQASIPAGQLGLSPACATPRAPAGADNYFSLSPQTIGSAYFNFAANAPMVQSGTLILFEARLQQRAGLAPAHFHVGGSSTDAYAGGNISLAWRGTWDSGPNDLAFKTFVQ